MINENMKIVLLYPPISRMERYSSVIGEAGSQQIPLGIYYLASYLRENGVDVRVTDSEVENLTEDEIIKRIETFSPQFVGVSSTTVAFHRALEIARAIKKHFEHIKIILGGPHITSNVSHAMSYYEFDYGVLREGEITLLELLKTLCDGGSIENVKGIAYRDDDCSLRVTSPREYISDLDILPFPAYDLVKDIMLHAPPPSNYKALPVVNMITSRGCPSQCTFCDRNVFGRKYRERSAENVFAEVKFLIKRYNVKEIVFVDDTFLINKQRLYKIFDLLEREKIYFHWTCMSRINDVDYEFLRFIKAKGCWHISFGIESGDDEIL
ncbi:MAG: cobalamin B12-binding domain-containing protein, partial [Nitrospirae bacterium]|nr:cobalamin B12-binding domain-containing protein [Nitrospirota bacterium]